STLRVQTLDTFARPIVERGDLAELNRIRRTGFGARRLQAAFQSIVAERAFVSFAVGNVHLDHTKRAGGHAVTAAVADILLNHHGVELGAKKRAGGTRFEAGSGRAVLADIAHHQPVALEWRQLGGAIAVGVLEFFDKTDVPPRGCRECAGVIVTISGELEFFRRQFVPFFARYFAGFAADAECGVGKKTIAAARLDPSSSSQLRFLRNDTGQQRFGIFAGPRLNAHVRETPC